MFSPLLWYMIYTTLHAHSRHSIQMNDGREETQRDLKRVFLSSLPLQTDTPTARNRSVRAWGLQVGVAPAMVSNPLAAAASGVDASIMVASPLSVVHRLELAVFVAAGSALLRRFS